MNTDIRISTSFKGHRKRKRLKRLLGPESDSYLIDLWLSVATDCPDGHMVGWDEVDIADACGWDDAPKKLVDALIECNWIEKDMHGEYAVHDWCIHQAWACKAGERSEIARKAAETRWKNKYAKDAEGMHDACGEDAESNAPIPSLPIPSLPNEEKEPSAPTVTDEEFYLTRKKKKLTGKRLGTFNRFWKEFNYKKSKAEAADAWLEIPELTNDLVTKIWKAAQKEAAKRPGLISSGRTPKMAQGWISAKRWEDEDPQIKQSEQPLQLNRDRTDEY